YVALTGGEVGSDTDFAGFARATVRAAQQLYGDGSGEVDAVRGAWDQVGVGNRAGPAADGASGPDVAGSVVVRRSGGVAGAVREGRLDLPSSAYGRTVVDQLARSAHVRSSAPQPDRFTYTIAVSGRRITVAEQDLTDELSQVVRLVLG